MAAFKFKLFTSADPQAQYDAVVTKDPMTFYLLNTGVGYLGSVKLFDATDDDNVLSNIVTDMLAEGFTADNTSVASTKAIVDYVADKVGNVSSVLSTSFFRKVESHTLTADDLTNSAITKPEGVTAGEVGLLFTADTDNEAGGESYYFISLKNYLQNVYTTQDTNSIKMSISADNKISGELKIKAGEESIKVDETNGGVYIDKATSINDGDGTTEGGTAPSATKLVTEEALVNYIINSVLPAVDEAIKDALETVVTYAIDDGTAQ